MYEIVFSFHLIYITRRSTISFILYQYTNGNHTTRSNTADVAANARGYCFGMELDGKRNGTLQKCNIRKYDLYKHTLIH